VAARAATPSAPSLLIRPDGYVAWSGTDPAGLRGALGRWFGTAGASAIHLESPTYGWCTSELR
jgi:hypothetical protein